QEKAYVDMIVAALRQAIVPAWLQAVEHATDRTRVGPLTRVLSARARELAPAIARALSTCGPEARRVAVAFLGCAGVGYEAVIAAQLPSSDERGGREALRALSRIGSSKAAAMLADQIETGPPWIAIAAEEAMWRLPPALG